MNSLSPLFILTGGPGAGKTTVLNALQQRGFNVMPEVARAIIQTQKICGGDAHHMGNRQAYTALMLEQSIADYLRVKNTDGPVFFDRGIPDLYSYTHQFCGGVTPLVKASIKHYRYNQTVFLFPPWPEIYKKDAERQQNFQEAIATYDSLKDGYTKCGYSLVEVPKQPIHQRCDFILEKIRPA